MKHKDLLITPKVDFVVVYFKEYQPIYSKLLREGYVNQLVQDIPEDYQTIRDHIVSIRNKGYSHILCCFDDGKTNIHTHTNKIFQVSFFSDVLISLF